jgi:hypothetical protein
MAQLHNRLLLRITQVKNPFDVCFLDKDPLVSSILGCFPQPHHMRPCRSMENHVLPSAPKTGRRAQGRIYILLLLR